MLNLILFGLKFVFVGLLFLFIFALIRTILKDTSLVVDSGVSETTAAKLVLNFGQEDSKTFSLTDKILIGRAETADIQIEDTFSSNNHARIYKQGSTYIVQDLKSTNGTKVNGAPIKKATLNDGDELAIGKAIFKFLQ